MLREGSGEPLVLLHGVTGSELMWRRVVPLLAPHHDTVALTALGHRGGRPAGTGTRIADVIDDAERSLDELGFDRPHLAGNSMGGWVALELARRGRAASVCALSPAGCWDASSSEHRSTRTTLKRVVAMTRAGRRAMPVVARVPAVRRIAMRDSAVHGDRLTVAELVELADDLLGCTVRDDLLATSEQLAPLVPAPCPITLAWSEKDRILPIDVNGARARELVPDAEWTVLPDVGHVPMLDDPELVARVVLAVSSAQEKS
jgi:pimeloyl-ACP methyl ester carboxylesterase